MKIFSKFAAAAVVATSVLSAAEVINLSDKNFWLPAKHVNFTENQMVPASRVMLRSKKLMNFDPAKKYTFKMEITGGEGSTKKALFLYGISPASEKGASYSSQNIQCIPATFTQLTSAAKKGDTEIKVKDVSKWKTYSHWVIAYNAKADFSDIPNRSIINIPASKIQKVGEEWVVTLKNPLPVDLAANTNLRQHTLGGYYYIGNKMIAPGATIQENATITGQAKHGTYNVKVFHPAVKHGYIIMLFDWNNSKVPLTIKNATLTIE